LGALSIVNTLAIPERLDFLEVKQGFGKSWQVLKTSQLFPRLEAN
jgi:hypothetical protein